MRACILFVALTMSITASIAQDFGPAFSGKWKLIEFKYIKSDGSELSMDLSGSDCFREATVQRSVSQCVQANVVQGRGVSRISSLTATQYELEIIESSRPESIGTRSRVEYYIDGGRLFIVQYSLPPNKIYVKSISVYVRQ
jgi:hypothetical protein